MWFSVDDALGCVQGCGVGPEGVAWPEWAQCVSEPWAHAWMYKITSRCEAVTNIWLALTEVVSVLLLFSMRRGVG